MDFTEDLSPEVRVMEELSKAGSLKVEQPRPAAREEVPGPAKGWDLDMTFNG